jgi:small subunit ribosomal protein S13e
MSEDACIFIFIYFWDFFLSCCSKGMSSSALPYKRTPPSWLKITTAEVEDHICKLAKKGLTPSQIGVILRDSHGIAQVNSVTGSKVLRILKGHGSI